MGTTSPRGSVYVFTRATAGDLASGWTQVAKLTADDGAEADRFGFMRVDRRRHDGDRGDKDDDKGANSGSAYVFTRDTAGDLASGWTQVAKLTADDGAEDDEFGSSVSIDGDTVVIGAYFDDDNGSNSGSAYVFTRATAGDLASGWTQVAKLTADDGAYDDVFGIRVSIDGDTMVIGSSSGSAYVFTRDTAGDLASGWTHVAKLTANDGAAGDEFGRSVSIDGNTVVVGAHYDNDPVKGDKSGSAYVFSEYVPPPCDASSPPANGAVGDCTSVLESGTTCQPVCDPGYFAPEPISVCDDGVLTPAVCVRYCNASAPPANGGVGDCVEYMLSDTTCQATCDEGYIVSGKSSCDASGALTAAVCRELSCCEQTFTKFGFGVAYSYGDEL